MNFSKYIMLSLLIFSIISCEDFFETQIELPTPEHIPILAVTSFIDAGDTYLSAEVNRTFGLFEVTPEEENKHVSNATIELYEEGELQLSFSSFENSNGSVEYFYSNLNEVLTEYGKTYELRVSHPDFEDMKATQTQPQPIPLTATEYQETTGSNFGDVSVSGQLKLTFDDPAGENNFYELYASRSITAFCINEDEERVDSTLRIIGINFPTDPPGNSNAELNYTYSSLLIKDGAFDGQTTVFNANVYENYYFNESSFFSDRDDCVDIEFENGIIKIYWRTVTEEYYRFTTSLRQNSEAQDNPFAEPVTVFTNFDNGVGAFCLRSELVYEVE